MARCVCGAPAPAAEGLGELQIVTDLDVPGIVALLTGELDYAQCDAGCRLDVRVSIAFHDTEAGRGYAAAGDLVRYEDLILAAAAVIWDAVEVVADVEELRRVVSDLVDRRLRVFLPVITGGPKGIGDLNYLGDNWRSFTAPVMAAVKVWLTGRVPQIGFVVHGVSQKFLVLLVALRQAGVWISILVDWMNGEGVGSFEEDLVDYVDRVAYAADPIEFVVYLDDLKQPADELPARRAVYRREALRASLYALVGRSNPFADRWARLWLWWEVGVRMAGGGGVVEVPALAVSVKRVRRTVPPDSARLAGTELLKQTLAATRDGSMAGPNGESLMTCLRKAFHNAGFDEQLVSIYRGMRTVDLPIEQVADGVVEVLQIEVPVTAALLAAAQAMAGALVDAGRVDDLKRVADAMRATVSATAVAGVSVWYYQQLYKMRMPKRLLEEAGETPAPDEDRLSLPDQAALLQLRALSLGVLGRPADALTLLDSAPREVLDVPGAKQGLGIARAALENDVGSPAAALARLEALLDEVDDPQPSLHETLMVVLVRFGRYEEAANHGRAAYACALRDRASWPVALYAAQVMWCQALGGRVLDADLVDVVLGASQSADPGRDMFAANALLTTGIAESDSACREFLDRVRTESERVLQQALAERDEIMAGRVLYVSALYDQVYRPDEALNSWARLAYVSTTNFDHNHRPIDGYFYLATNLIAAGWMAPARDMLKIELSTRALGYDSGLRIGTLAGAHTAREIDLVTAAMFTAPGATQADLRLVGDLRRGLASRAIVRADEEPAWWRHGLDDEVVAGIAPSRGRVGVLEWVSDGTDVRALITVVDAAGSVTSAVVPLPDVDLGRVATRMRSRLSTWRAGRPGDPFSVAEWQVCRTWLGRLLDDHLAPDDHLVVIPFPGWRQLPWHVAAFDRVTCSYEPSWVALLSTVTRARLPERFSEGVVTVPRVGDPAEITEAMARYVARCGDGVRVLDGVAANRDAVKELLANVDLVTLLTHGYTSAAETEVALMLAADGSLPLAHSVAAASERGRAHRFGWREYAELTEAPQVILSAACGTGGGHIVGLGEHLGIYNVLRQVGLRAYVAPQWDITAADVLPLLGDIRACLLAQKVGLGQCVRQAVRQAIDRGTPAWSAHALILEGDW